MSTIPPHIAITYQPKSRYAPLKRETPPATEDPPMIAPKPLSPAAQAVKDHLLANIPVTLEHGLAAALREIADQVVPEMEHPDAEEWLGQSAWMQAESRIRFRLLAIAAELEGHHG